MNIMRIVILLHYANERRNIAESNLEAMEDFLQDVLGDYDIHTINDKDKERIKEFVKGIMAEWDEREGQ